MKSRIADYIINRVFNAGAKHIFFVPGAGCMYLVDALAKSTDIKAISMHHEQAAGMAALTYAKSNETIGACLVTTGCGGTNAITACLHAWQDNVPCVFISGQAARNQTIRNASVPLRQFGRQEADIVSIVSPITKYAVMLNDPLTIAGEIEKAIYIAQHGRKGPVWIDVPADIQCAMLNTDTQNEVPFQKERTLYLSQKDKDFVLEELRNAKRPILLAGNGIRLAGAIDEFTTMVETMGLPVVWSRLGQDLLEYDNPYAIGMVGALGTTRAGNFAIQNADLVLCVGCRLSINTTGYEYQKFARNARLIVVDIDRNEHAKKTVHIDKFIHADAHHFFASLLRDKLPAVNKQWQEKCLHWKNEFPPVKIPSTDDGKINMYRFIDALSNVLPNNATVLSDAGSTYYITSSSIRISRKRNQRSITSAAQAEMGYSLPASIGAAYAHDGIVVAVSGDGSLMMNIQELETLAYRQPNVKLCVMNNNGYSSIRISHRSTFGNRVIGTDPTCGLGLPDFEKLAEAFGLQYVRIEKTDNLESQIETMLKLEGSVLCEVICTPSQEFLHVNIAKNEKGRFEFRPIEDQAPFLDRNIIINEMIVEPLM